MTITLTITAESAAELYDTVMEMAAKLGPLRGQLTPPGDVTWVPVAPEPMPLPFVANTAEAHAENAAENGVEEAAKSAPKEKKGRNGRARTEHGVEKDAAPKEITYDEVSALAQKIFSHDEKGRLAIVGLKKELSVARFGDLQAEQYATAFERLQEIAAELEVGA